MLKLVTFTGVDRKTDIDELKELYREYPFIEFGLLVSEQWEIAGNEFIDPAQLALLKNSNLKMSAHICGRLAREVIQNGDWTDIRTQLCGNLNLFDRIQLNVARNNLKDSWKLTVPDEVSSVIIQQRSVIEMPLYKGYLAALEQGFQIQKIVPFFDASGGKGLYEAALETADVPYAGYAGGLNPENAVDFIRMLEKSPNVADYWIDMQQSLRDAEDWFSPGIVRRVCEVVSPIIYL